MPGMTINVFKKSALFIAGLFLLGMSSCFDSNEIDFDKQLEEDLAVIDQYLSDNGITAISDSTGQIRLVIHNSTAGEIASIDSCITANFTGWLLSEGTKFTDGEEFSFPLAGDLIKGWKLAIPLLHQGDSATFYIPSVLAYGSTGIPDEGIPANANVFFHFRLLYVGKTYDQSP